MAGSSGKPRGPRVKWQLLEKKMRGNAAVQVNVLPLQVPRYSFEVGSAEIDPSTGDLRLKKHLTSFNVMDAAALLAELGEKYVNIREEKIDEIEAAKERWQVSNTSTDDA